MKKMFLPVVITSTLIASVSFASPIKCYSVNRPVDDGVSVDVIEGQETVLTVHHHGFFGKRMIGQYLVHRTVGLTVLGAGVNFVNEESGVNLKISPTVYYSAPTSQRPATLVVQSDDKEKPYRTALICKGLIPKKDSESDLK
ncbi:hypothetical protein [Bdellovibrio reynosensis]|uniref:Uncharacterized protein n=1 Tax=Bdellovibrio reynosensis TaxID=2835041 RepID=A0ABY4C4Y6_9BACT|nr:hypothetical protein [Bdellovibrio reynosensis]UOF00027.1 hypothetical protein MNR06_09970 [Bdellovibrio reynosensis]